MAIRLEDVESWVRCSSWRLSTVMDGFRIFEQVTQPELGVNNSRSNLLAPAMIKLYQQSSPLPALRININVDASSWDAFSTLMNMPPACLTGIIRSMRVVESMDNQTDIVHMVLDGLYMYPTWTGDKDCHY